MTITKKIVLIDIAFWLIIHIYTIYALYGGSVEQSLPKTLLFLPIVLAQFYFTRYILIKLDKKKDLNLFYKNSFPFCTIIVFTAIHYATAQYITDHHIFPNGLTLRNGTPINILKDTFFVETFICFFSIGIWNFHKKQQQDKQLDTLLKNRLENELSQLQSQIHPHFLLNTLNNLYVLTLEKSVKTPATILKLADLLRYMTYENNNHYTLLSREIEAIGNYLDLMQVKHQENLNIKIDSSYTTKEIKIPSNIIFPLLENAFKHSNIGYEDNSFIRVAITESITQKQLNIRIENNIAKKYTQLEFGGVGLSNVMSRLELLFPNQNLLHTAVVNNVFIAQLVLEY